MEAGSAARPSWLPKVSGLQPAAILQYLASPPPASTGLRKMFTVPLAWWTRLSPPHPPGPEHSLLPRATIPPISTVEAAADLDLGKAEAQTLRSLPSECKATRSGLSLAYPAVSQGRSMGSQEVPFVRLFKGSLGASVLFLGG